MINMSLMSIHVNPIQDMVSITWAHCDTSESLVI